MSKPTNDGVPALIRRLVEELETAGITYCHWKSNDMLAASAAGDNDLDLLVSKEAMTRCRALLHEMGFVEGVQPPSRRPSGVLDYLGNEPSLPRPVHVHLHGRLVLGDDMTKNYRLPIEDEYLASTQRRGFIPVPAPEFELMVFVIRMVLKHCAWDAIVMLQGRLADSERRELRWLCDEASLGETHALVDRLLPEVGSELFGRCLSAISRREGLQERTAIGRRLRTALTPFSRRPVALDITLKSLRRVYWLSRRYVKPRARRKALAHGGMVVALGGDLTEAARQDVVEQLDRWLSKDVAVWPARYGRDPLDVSRRALRFAASGGLVLTADHPTVDGAQTIRVPPPDLEIVVSAAAGSDAAIETTGHRVVHVVLSASEEANFRAVQRALWSRL